MGERETGEEQQGHWRAAEQAWLAALEIYTKEALPRQHGMAQRNLERVRKKLLR